MISHLFNRSLTVSRPTRTADAAGGHTWAFSTQGTVKARVRPARAAERARADREEIRLTHVVYVGPSEDVQRNDQLLGGGQTLKVLSIRDPSVSGHHREVDCEEVVTGV